MKINKLKIEIKKELGTIHMLATQEGEGNQKTRRQKTQHPEEKQTKTNQKPNNLPKKPRKSM